MKLTCQKFPCNDGANPQHKQILAFWIPTHDKGWLSYFNKWTDMVTIPKNKHMEISTAKRQWSKEKWDWVQINTRVLDLYYMQAVIMQNYD